MLALAGHAFWQPALAADDFLDPDKAFQFSARPLDAKTIEVTFDIAPGYYLYRDQFRFTAKDATLGTPVIPPGKTKFDETFQKTVETYRNSVKISVPVEGASGTFRFVTTSQGCADAGLCYPPQRAAAMVSLAGFGGTGSVQPAPAEDAGSNGSDLAATSASPTAAAALTTAAATTAVRLPTTAAARGDAGAIESVLRSGAFWPIVGAFFVAGLLLSLTPCVLPMLPIISSIIVGQGGYGGGALAGVPGTVTTTVSRARGFTLAASYSFGMAIVYTAFGVAAGLAGEGLSAALQNPWVLGAFALGLVVLSLSMFGVYELQLPDALVGRFNTAAQRMPAGRVAGVCAMGGVSALIVSPCVAAPLAGALLYLSQTRDVWLGGTALFSLAAGMSVPLLLVGASAGALLPRAGAWMVEVKMAFGVLLVGVALWTVQPVMPAPMAVACWGLLAFGAAALTMARGRSTGRSTTSAAAAVTAARPVSHATWRYAVAGVLGIVGLLEIVGAAAGGDDPLQPLARLTTHGDRTASTAAAGPTFAPGQEHRRARRGPAPRRPSGGARLLCRLVRLLQGNGALRLHRSGRAKAALGRVAAARRRDRQRCRRPRPAAPLPPLRSADDDLLRCPGQRDRTGPSDRLPEHRALPADIGQRGALSHAGPPARRDARPPARQSVVVVTALVFQNGSRPSR